MWRQRRFRCRDCGRTSRERHPALAGQKRISRRFIDQLGDASRNEPWIAVARRESVSWWRIADAFTIKATCFDPYLGPAPKVLSIDEASFRRRFLFHTVLSAPEQRRVLELIPGRNQMSAFKALSSLPRSWREEVETVVIDLYWPFRKAVEQVLPEARIVADKFHVIRVIDNAAQKVRIRHGRRVTVIGRDGGLSRQHNPRFRTEMWQTRWLFMRRRHALNPAQLADLENLFETSPQVGVAWWLKEAFAEIYQANDRAEAEQRLALWIDHVHTAGLPELENAWRTLSHWTDPILNYFDDRQTNAYAEGITNKIKVLKNAEATDTATPTGTVPKSYSQPVTNRPKHRKPRRPRFCHTPGSYFGYGKLG